MYRQSLSHLHFSVVEKPAECLIADIGLIVLVQIMNCVGARPFGLDQYSPCRNSEHLRTTSILAYGVRMSASIQLQGYHHNANSIK